MNALSRFAQRRLQSALVKRKRFYKTVDVVAEKDESEVVFKVTLDKKVLKTQAGKPLRLKSEPLALAIAEEWASQGDSLLIPQMRLTGLAFTATDNPLHLDKNSIVQKILEHLETDTVLFPCIDNDKLFGLQKREWSAVIDVVNKDHSLSLHPFEELTNATLSEENRRSVTRLLESHSFWALIGWQYAVEALKSAILPMAVFGHRITVDEAVNLATLEQRFQANIWGNVEWAHDVEREELRSRLAAAALFVYFSANSQVKGQRPV